MLENIPFNDTIYLSLGPDGVNVRHTFFLEGIIPPDLLLCSKKKEPIIVPEIPYPTGSFWNPLILLATPKTDTNGRPGEEVQMCRYDGIIENGSLLTPIGNFWLISLSHLEEKVYSHLNSHIKIWERQEKKTEFRLIDLKGRRKSGFAHLPHFKTISMTEPGHSEKHYLSFINLEKTQDFVEHLNQIKAEKGRKGIMRFYRQQIGMIADLHLLLTEGDLETRLQGSEGFEVVTQKENYIQKLETKIRESDEMGFKKKQIILDNLDSFIVCFAEQPFISIACDRNVTNARFQDGENIEFDFESIRKTAVFYDIAKRLNYGNYLSLRAHSSVVKDLLEHYLTRATPSGRQMFYNVNSEVFWEAYLNYTIFNVIDFYHEPKFFKDKKGRFLTLLQGIDAIDLLVEMYQRGDGPTHKERIAGLLCVREAIDYEIKHLVSTDALSSYTLKQHILETNAYYEYLPDMAYPHYEYSLVAVSNQDAGLCPPLEYTSTSLSIGNH
ncbi:hypothetical protein JXB41_03640 [Candidatus Woesearchaeota archaeon]|nr:hypothetical protein [Candidatus Woesearchaeota archaeon]